MLWLCSAGVFIVAEQRGVETGMLLRPCFAPRPEMLAVIEKIEKSLQTRLRK
jgi:hypothetical protein